MIVLDTSVLSHVFRRQTERPSEPNVIAQYISLVEGRDPIAIPGVVLQEILSGVRTADQFERLRSALEGFPILLASPDDHLEAARLMNRLRAAGIAGSSFDALIAAMTMRRGAVLFTLDRDFERMASVLPLKLLATS